MTNDKIYFQENRPQARGILWVHHSQFKDVGSPTILDFIDASGRVIPIAKEEVPAISTDIASDATSDAKTASPKAVKEYVSARLAELDLFKYEVYGSTSAVTSPSPTVLYLIGPTGTGSDKYEEYIYSSNDGFVKIGDTTIDLSNKLNGRFLQKTQYDALSGYEPYADSLYLTAQEVDDEIDDGVYIVCTDGTYVKYTGDDTLAHSEIDGNGKTGTAVALKTENMRAVIVENTVTTYLVNQMASYDFRSLENYATFEDAITDFSGLWNTNSIARDIQPLPFNAKDSITYSTSLSAYIPSAGEYFEILGYKNLIEGAFAFLGINTTIGTSLTSTELDANNMWAVRYDGLGTISGVGVGKTSSTTIRPISPWVPKHTIYNLYAGKTLVASSETANNSNNGSEVNIVETTWADLTSLRDADQLKPGMQYRITDYNTTTTQDDTISAGHQFDIIVVADSENKLNENARAALHDGDTYFTTAGAKLESWELKYCIDNDTNKFDWADSVNGKGIIYWMKDEWNNECPYDFKNIKFNGYYTFSSTYGGSTSDFSLNTNGRCRDNKIGKWMHSTQRLFYLNRIYFINTGQNSNCNSNVFADDCCDNVFGSDCCVNSFDYGCQLNSFGDICTLNNFGVMCQHNTFGNDFSSNDLHNNCSNNVFGKSCTNNIFLDKCSNNNFSANCCYNFLNYFCTRNTFSEYVDYVTMQVGCSYNILGKEALDVNIGSSCSYITISPYSQLITIGNHCNHIKFGNSSSNVQYYSNIIVEDNNKNIYLNCTGQTSSMYYYKNIKICQATNTSNTWKTINDPNVNQDYQTEYKATASQVVSV